MSASEKLSTSIEMRMRSADPNDPHGAVGGTRSDAGTNYGDFAPSHAPPGMADPSRGAEMERDVQPANGRFDQAPEFAAPFESHRAATSPGSVTPRERTVPALKSGGATTSVNVEPQQTGAAAARDRNANPND